LINEPGKRLVMSEQTPFDPDAVPMEEPVQFFGKRVNVQELDVHVAIAPFVCPAVKHAPKVVLIGALLWVKHWEVLKTKISTVGSAAEAEEAQSSTAAASENTKAQRTCMVCRGRCTVYL